MSRERCSREGKYPGICPMESRTETWQHQELIPAGVYPGRSQEVPAPSQPPWRVFCWVKPHVGLLAPIPGLGPSGAHGGAVIPDPPPGTIPDRPRGIHMLSPCHEVSPAPPGFPILLQQHWNPKQSRQQGLEEPRWIPGIRGREIRDKPAPLLGKPLVFPGRGTFPPQGTQSIPQLGLECQD